MVAIRPALFVIFFPFSISSKGPLPLPFTENGKRKTAGRRAMIWWAVPTLHGRPNHRLEACATVAPTGRGLLRPGYGAGKPRPCGRPQGSP
jgi:hypothetical protein